MGVKNWNFSKSAFYRVAVWFSHIRQALCPCHAHLPSLLTPCCWTSDCASLTLSLSVTLVCVSDAGWGGGDVQGRLCASPLPTAVSFQMQRVMGTFESWGGDRTPLPLPLALPCPPPASGDFAKEEGGSGNSPGLGRMGSRATSGGPCLLPSPSKPSWCLNHCKTLADVLEGWSVRPRGNLLEEKEGHWAYTSRTCIWTAKRSRFSGRKQDDQWSIESLVLANMFGMK